MTAEPITMAQTEKLETLYSAFIAARTGYTRKLDATSAAEVREAREKLISYLLDATPYLLAAARRCAPLSARTPPPMSDPWTDAKVVEAVARALQRLNYGDLTLIRERYDRDARAALRAADEAMAESGFATIPRPIGIEPRMPPRYQIGLVFNSVEKADQAVAMLSATSDTGESSPSSPPPGETGAA